MLIFLKIRSKDTFQVTLFWSNFIQSDKSCHTECTLFKKVLHDSLLFFWILNFQYLWNLEKWSDQAQIFRECLMHELLLFL